jgi:cysteine desulfuration protein SufE
MSLPSYEDIAENLSYLDDWEERYAYVIQLGRSLPPLADDLKTDVNKVMGCASQVWLATDVQDGSDPVLTFAGDSDAHIVRGLVALAVSLNSGKTASEIIATDTFDKFEKLGLKVSSQRSNGLRSMVARIRHDAERALTQT